MRIADDTVFVSFAAQLHARGVVDRQGEPAARIGGVLLAVRHDLHASQGRAFFVGHRHADRRGPLVRGDARFGFSAVRSVVGSLGREREGAEQSRDHGRDSQCAQQSISAAFRCCHHFETVFC